MGRIAGVTAAEVRERLLRAAADVFAQRGYDGTRVADIARAAGVSNAALYAHFDSKAGLLVEAVRDTVRGCWPMSCGPIRPGPSATCCCWSGAACPGAGTPAVTWLWRRWSRRGAIRSWPR
jgi:hypothetical protein